MQNHLTYEQLALYTEHLKNSTLEQCPQDLRNHIENCNQCAVEAAELCTLTDDIEIQTKPKQSLFGKQRYLFVLAAAAGVLMIVAIWFLMDTSGTKRDYLSENNTPGLIDTGNIHDKPLSYNAGIKPPDTNAKQQPDDSLGKADIMFGQAVPEQTDETSADSKYYSTHRPTEILVHNFKGNMRSTHVDILSPSEITVTNETEQPVLLKWENNAKMQLTVELLNNSGEVYKEYQTQEDSLLIKSLPHKGLYYWKLFNHDFDLLFCGKIIFR